LVNAGPLRVSAHSVAEWPRVVSIWDQLFHEAWKPSVFLSAAWTGTWLETYGDKLHPLILIFEHKEQVVGACLLVESRGRHGIVRTRRLSLNASGEDASESTYIEYNGVLSISGWETAVGDALARDIAARRWDELSLDGISGGPALCALEREFSGLQQIERQQPCYFVDLAALRLSGSTYESALRSHYRKSLRRNIKVYSQDGPIATERAADPESALRMFGELAAFNRRRWAESTRRSSFESPRFLEFHRRLIRRSLESGLVELLRVHCGGRSIGIVYNLCLDRKVYFYQCGFDYEVSGSLSPGMVALANAIQHALDSGMDDWDFLAGDSLFKRSLSTGVRHLSWLRFYRPGWKTHILAAARIARTRFSKS
jgi:CelD/BcsL family acetyltransferase involved in cellulose biosynthesis